ncbi:TD and POZ domain-containing protein 4 [Argiope bruennichi]|uniref:TD and POZ domain-containing protein 4 n=1 Tax=Argiope bruennichi TaxID=94029 RepID=A0A8T0ED89_ARGBR|nr:TD and POZ domain-containing protein 4 [Argiope bruennichi]
MSSAAELSVLTANGDVIVSQVERGRPYFSWTILRFWPLISKTQLIASKNLFLPNDTLVLKCSFEVCIGVISSEIEYCTPNVSPVVEEEEEVQNINVTTMEADDSLEFEEYFIKDDNDDGFDNSLKDKIDAYSCNKSCPLKAALRLLHTEAILSDIDLQIGAKLYPVHKNILCSRSPVFRTIFSKDMKENVIKINHMDEKTLCRLLQYFYTDTVGHLQFENVLDLYKAAADYHVLDLKNICSDLLIMNLSKYNVRDILSLANKYQDERLEKTSRGFVMI